MSFNILYKDSNRKIILTESPYLFVNDNIRLIIDEIRKIVKEDLIKISDDMNIPAIKLCLGMTTFVQSESSNIHFFEVDAINIRELNKALLERSLL